MAGRPRKNDEDKAKPTDILTCKTCGGTYQRSCKSKHNKTRVHMAYADINDRMKHIISDKLKQPEFIRQMATEMVISF